MDDSERLAHQYLTSLELGRVTYEPDGNVPPDFAVDDRIAVEVRRLNQNYECPEGRHEGLEQLWIPLWQRLRRHLPTLGPSQSGECWYVSVDFRRPLEQWRTLRPRLDQALMDFRANPIRERTTIQVTPNFTVDLLRSGIDHGTFYLLGASSDDDSGGWVMGELERNLRLCIAEKERKIAPYRARYKRWWLVLADHIDYGMDPEDHEVFRTEVMPRISHSFEKVILVDPRNHRRSVEA